MVETDKCEKWFWSRFHQLFRRSLCAQRPDYQGQTLGLVLFCNRNVLVIYSFAENSMATYMVY